MNYKQAALIILAVVFLYQLMLHYLHALSAKRPIPENVKGVYDEETYLKWKRYHGDKSRLHLVSGVYSFLIDFLLMALDVYALAAGLFGQNLYVQLLIVMLVSVLSALLLMPFEYYDTMVLEEKYGFNRSTKKTFWLDQVKSLLVSFLLMGGLATLLCALHQALGDWMVLLFAALLMLLILLIAFLFPFFGRLFNKFAPLEDGELKDKLTALLEKNGYHVRGIKVMDASRRTTKSNAYFTGFGRMKTIVLYDTLIKAMIPDEICAVFAHEMGHGLHKDTLVNQVFSFAQMAVIAVLAWLTVRSPEIFTFFGFDSVNYGFALILIMSVEFALISPLFALLINAHSRKAEYQADAQAVREGYGEPLKEALKKLSRENLSDLSPHPWLVKLEYSHPTLSQRLNAIEKEMKK